MQNIRIIVADDQLLIRAGIRALVESQGGYQIVAECADGNEAVAAVRTLRPDVILLDIAMPGLSGIEVARQIRDTAPDTRILMVSSIERQEVVDQAMAAGADGYLLKDFVLSELQNALLATIRGETYLSPRIVPAPATETGDGRSAGELLLTARQTEILRLVASGRTTKEIARDLGISPKTVEFHRARLMERIGVRDVTGLTRFALQTGVVR